MSFQPAKDRTPLFRKRDERFGIALVEALSTGLVCIAADGPGPRGIIVNGENGFPVASSDDAVLEGLRRAMKLLPQERIRKGALAWKNDARFVQWYDLLDAMGIPRVS